jgi:putative transposase
MLTFCEAATRKVRADFGTGLREFNGKAGHVHLIVDYPPEAAVSALVNSLKEVSARRLRSEFTGRVNRASMRGHFWSPSYFAASRGGAPPSIIRQDIGARQDRAALRSLPVMPSRTSGASRRRPGPPRRGRIAGRPPRPAAG